MTLARHEATPYKERPVSDWRNRVLRGLGLAAKIPIAGYRRDDSETIIRLGSNESKNN